MESDPIDHQLADQGRRSQPCFLFFQNGTYAAPSTANWSVRWQVLERLWCICGPQNGRFPACPSRIITPELAPIAA